MPNKLPSGKWRAQVFIGRDSAGKRRYKYFTADTKALAELAALQYKATLPRTERGVLTVDKALNNYIAANRAVLSPATVTGYLAVQRQLRRIVPYLLDANLYDVDSRLLQRAVGDLSASIGAKSVRNAVALVRRVVTYNGYVPPAVALPKSPRPELSIPDEDTLRRLYEAVSGTRWEVPVLLAATGPMRRGEIVAASIDDLSDDNVLYVHRTAVISGGKQVIKDYPKTDGSNRYITLDPKVANLIRAQGYVTKMSLKTISTRFGQMLEREGLPRFRFHDLRHSFVSVAHAAGIPDAYIMARGGWSTPSTMQNVYRHTLDADRQKMEAEINQKMGTILGIDH